MNAVNNKFIESREEIITCLNQIEYLIQNRQVVITCEKYRAADSRKDTVFTNRYTLNVLFPDEYELEVLEQELRNLKLEEYLETVIDNSVPGQVPMRVFGKKYGKSDVYIKFQIQLLSEKYGGSGHILVKSFHFAEWQFKESDFPYRRMTHEDN